VNSEIKLLRPLTFPPTRPPALQTLLAILTSVGLKLLTSRVHAAYRC